MFKNLFLPKIENVCQARKVYYNARTSQSTQEFALRKWNKIYLLTVERIVHSRDINTFFKLSRSDDMPPEGEAKDAFDAAFDFFVLMISTSQQARHCYNQCKNDRAYFSRVVKKWNEISLIEIENASNISEIKNAVENSLFGSDAFEEGELKWMDLCQTVHDIQELICFSPNEKIKKDLQKKKESILLAETPKVTDILIIKDYYHSAPIGSAVKFLIFEKWLELCVTPEEASEAYGCALSDEWRAKAYEKVKCLAS